MKKTYIVDGNSLLFRAYYSTAYTGNLMTTKEGIPTNAIFAFHNLIKKIKALLKEEDHLFVSFDTGKETFRKKEFGEYKAQRAPAPQELVCQMPIARELLDAMNICWDEKEGYEGDDLAGSMAKLAIERGEEVRLYTSDKDFLQLLDLSDNITCEILKKGLTETICYTKANLEELFGLRPDQIVDYKGIAGDSSDNYKGIKGVGDKTAMKLLKEHGHLEDIITYAKSHPENKTNQKFIESEKEALFFKSLATIYTDLDMNADFEKSQYRPYEKSKLSAFYRKYQMNHFISVINKMPGMIDDTTHQLSLFDDDISFQEEKEIAKSRPTRIISSFSEIPDPVGAFYLEANGENENTATLLSFLFATHDCIYQLPLKDAKADTSLSAFLADKNKKLAVYDYKSILVLLSRFSFTKLEGVSFDLLLATYLLNPDVGQRVDSLFLSYDISLNPDLNLAIQICSYTLDLKDKVEEELKKNGQEELFSKVELPLANILANMEIEGFPIDLPTLAKIDADYKEILSECQRKIYELASHEFNLNSPKQVEAVLFDELGITRNKGEKGTGIEVLNAHKDDHPIIPLLIEYRLYNKLVSGYTTTLPNHTQKDGKIHAIYNQALTTTGRLSMSEPNLQNISIRNEEGKSIRKAFFYPEDDVVILSLDYSQIELRMLAHIADIKVLQEIFHEGQDIHRATASRVFHVPFDEVTDEMRRRAKAVNFGIVYGISPYGLSNQLNISTKEASELISQFKETFQGIDEFQKSAIEHARENGYITTILNRRRYLKDINSSNRALRQFSERAAVNAIIQGSAADLIKVAMIRCEEALKNYQSKLILQIHDELLFKVPVSELEEVRAVLIDCMDNALKLKVPLKVDGSAKKTWYEAH